MSTIVDDDGHARCGVSAWFNKLVAKIHTHTHIHVRLLVFDILHKYNVCYNKPVKMSAALSSICRSEVACSHMLVITIHFRNLQTHTHTRARLGSGLTGKR